MAVTANTQTFTILAQDPAIEAAPGQPLFARVGVPLERLAEGPSGYRVKVVDFDASANRLYLAPPYQQVAGEAAVDPFDPPDAGLLGQPGFHCQQVYAVIMRLLARFELALGRRVAWGFDGHQLHVVPHAFVEANAYYSREDRALLFGYFQDGADWVFTCLSHDIVAHETTHALLDGLRAGFMRASGPDQAAFHEGFADVIALLSVFSLGEVVEFALTCYRGVSIRQQGDARLIDGAALDIDALADTLLFGLGEQFGQATSGLRGNPLRRSAEKRPSTAYLGSAEYDDAHSRGEIFSAAMLRSLLELWIARCKALGTFGDYGIQVPPGLTDANGCWLTFSDNDKLRYQNSHFDSLLRDTEEVFRFLWENRELLQIDERAYTEVVSVRPSLRLGPDGFVLRETVCEFTSRINLFGAEFTSVFKEPRPDWLHTTTPFTVYGAGTLIFDQYGRIKYCIQRPLSDTRWQVRRLEWLYGPGSEVQA